MARCRQLGAELVARVGEGGGAVLNIAPVASVAAGRVVGDEDGAPSYGDHVRGAVEVEEALAKVGRVGNGATWRGAE